MMLRQVDRRRPSTIVLALGDEAGAAESAHVLQIQASRARR